MKWFKYVAFIFLIVGAFKTQGQLYKLKGFNAEEGLSNLFINSATQDTNGYLWIGTGEGLFRFDGMKFKKFSEANGLAQNFVSYCGYENGSVWVGHNNGKVSKVAAGKIDTLKLALEVPLSSKIIGVYSIEDQTIIVSQNEGISVVNNDKSVTQVSLDENVYISSSYHHNNTIIIGASSGVYIYDLESKKVKKTKPSFLNVKSLASYDNNHILLATQSSIFKLKMNDNQVQVDTLKSPYLSGNEMISHISSDHNKDIWISTFGEGIILLKNPFGTSKDQNVIRYSQNSGLGSNYASLTYHDREGNSWFGLYGAGLSFLQDEAFTFHFDYQVAEENDVTDVIVNDSVRWTAIENQLIKTQKTSDKKTTYELSNNINISCLLESESGDLFVGTQRSGVFKLNHTTGKFQQVFKGETLLSNKINDLEINHNQLWIGTHDGLYHLNTLTNQNKHYSTKNGLRHNVINALSVDSSGATWVGSRGNVVAVIKNDEIIERKLPHNIRMTEVSDLSKDENNYMWVATNGDGVYCIKPDTVIEVTKAQGLYSDFCYSIIAAPENGVWVGHRGGLSKIALSDDKVEKFDKASEIINDFNIRSNAFDASKKELWFGTKTGLIRCDLDKFVHENIIFSPHVSSLYINGEKVSFREDIYLPYQEHKLVFRYNAINLRHPERTRYSYTLEGYENEWHHVGQAKTATYKRVSEGNYRFIVKAENGLATKTYISPFKIIVKKPFWMKGWFYVTIVLILFGIGLVIISIRERNFRKSRALLNRKIEEATKEIKTKNDNLMASITYAKKIQDALLPDILSYKNYFSDYFILNKPRDIVGGDFYWFGMNRGSLVIAVGDCTGHGVPGGFMTMLGINQLNTIVNEKGITDPSVILAYLNVSILELLNSSSKAVTVTDGMDISICTISFKDQKIHYSGAKRPLVLIKDGQLQEIKPTRKSIGDLGTHIVDFELHTFDFNSGDSIYMYSDGYSDQIGGLREKKFNKRQLYKLIRENQMITMDDQKRVLENAFNEWAKYYDFQLDDVLVCGFKF